MQRIEVRQRNWAATAHEGFHDLDPPRRRHPPALLPPFQARGLACAKFCRDIIDGLPGECLGHAPMIGQIVQSVKDNLPHDCHAWRRYNLSVSNLMTPSEYEELFIARVKALRESKGLTAAQMATALDIPAERYRKYESRSPLPHGLVERFALIVGVSVDFLMTGRRVQGGGPYPDVPGPQSLSELRGARLLADEKANPKKVRVSN